MKRAHAHYARVTGMEDNQNLRTWRRNSAAVMTDPAGRVLLCKAKGVQGYWHFPQGGANEGEGDEDAVKREVKEEVGISPQSYMIIDKMDGLRYRYREGHRKTRKWLGQQQTYFLLRCSKEKQRVKLDKTKEFVSSRWMFPKDISLDMFTPGKRKVVEKVLIHFLSVSPEIFRENRKKVPLTKIVQQLPDMMDFKKYLIKPGQQVRLQEHSPDERSLFAGTKEESFVEFNRLREEMQYHQKLLYAENRRKILIVIQAMDTGGKDGCIRHVFGWIDPQGINVVAFKKPTPEELGHDFLWRVHKACPGAGQITVFNRSHYEDIIAAGVKKLLPEERWKKRYRHICDFEQLLADEGTVILKFFLNISKAEQKARIESRLKDPDKYWKFHEDDLIDRAQWNAFQDAYSEVIERTTADHAPWYVIPSNRKWYRNLIVARIFVDTLRNLNMKYPHVDFDPAKIVVED